MSDARLPQLAKTLLRKSVWLLVVFLGITLMSFFVIHLAPGSPTDLETTMNPLADSDARDRLNAIYGLDKPLHEQYVLWLKRVAVLDFGNSMSSDPRPVIDKIGEALPLTLCLNAATLLFTLIIAVPLGVAGAGRRGGLFDRITTVLVFLGFSMPTFWLALLLMMFFAVDLGWLPLSGLRSLDFDSLPVWGRTLDLLRHLALPLFVTIFTGLAGMSRFMRASVIEALRSDYITAARAKGLSEHAVLYRHALRNALLPVITILGLSVPGLIGGSVIIESIFALPGMGQLFYKAVMARDYPLIMGNLVIGAVLTLAGNLLADLCYGLADPRIRTGGT